MEAKADTRNRLPLKSSETEVLQCPSCDARLTKYEVAQHCEQEMECLRQSQTQLRTVPDVASVTSENVATVERGKPWTIFQRVQRNRQTRLKQRSRKRPAVSTEHPCPICNASYPQDEIQQHTEHCLRRSRSTLNGGAEDNSSNEDDDGEEYEEYEWAGQKRIRVSSLLQGGYASIGVGQTITNSQTGEGDEEEDLNVDEDDTQIYGPPQYGEGDIPHNNEHNGESDITTYMRRLITGTQTNAESVANTARIAEVNTDGENALPATPDDEKIESRTTAKDVKHKSEASSSTFSSVQHCRQVIDSLKAKLRHYENHIPSKFKCLICLDDYRNPAISVYCWHVHCEECWLRSLGARKLCPQCNLITTPKDLRRIYM